MNTVIDVVIPGWALYLIVAVAVAIALAVYLATRRGD